MKVLKGISLFFLYPVTMFGLGFWGGVELEHFFYPGEGQPQEQHTETVAEIIQTGQTSDASDRTLNTDKMMAASEQDATVEAKPETEVWAEAAARPDTLFADTEYVLLEADLLHDTEVETTWRLPSQYIGMDREQFLVAIENYSSYPPLSEMERGFVSAEVVSFARERVTVRKSYQYIQPDEGFYLAVENHEIVVYLEDKETIFMNTGILLENLPEDIQIQIIGMLYVEDQGVLYNFLETYSS